MEPTGIRWSLYRRPVSAAQIINSGDTLAGQVVQYAPLGISFGHGLFLDSIGNLSILPLKAWGPVKLADGARYEAHTTTLVWNSLGTSNFTLQGTEEGLLVTNLTWGNSVTVTPTAEKYQTMGWRVEKGDGGEYSQVSLSLVGASHKYKNTGTMVKHTVTEFMTNNEINFKVTDQGVSTSDDSFTLLVEGDHWRINLATPGGPKSWLYYFSTDKAMLIDPSDGESASIEATASAVTLKSGANQEIVSAKP